MFHSAKPAAPHRAGTRLHDWPDRAADFCQARPTPKQRRPGHPSTGEQSCSQWMSDEPEASLEKISIQSSRNSQLATKPNLCILHFCNFATDLLQPKPTPGTPTFTTISADILVSWCRHSFLGRRHFGRSAHSICRAEHLKCGAVQLRMPR
jgi:hypothetical protein